MKSGYAKVLINEMIVPDIGVGMIECQLGFMMMVIFAGTERARNQLA